MLNRIYKNLILSFVIIVWLSFADSAKVYLSGETENLILNCANNIDIMIDSQWDEIYWVVTNLSYDWKNIEIVWFYPNEKFNLPAYSFVKEYDDFAIIENSLLSLLRNDDFDHIWFTWLVKVATLVIKNKSNVENTEIDIVKDGKIFREKMKVFRLWDAKDVLKEVESKTFNFVQGECLHTSPDGTNQMDPNYDFRAHLDKNLKAISNLEKMYPYKKMFLKYWSYGLIVILIVVLFVVMYKRWMFKNIRVLKNKENKND